MRVGSYEVVTRFASGGMAEIFAARGTDGGVVILKQMLPQFRDKPDYVEMFFDEGRTVSLMRHRNIVRMHDFGFHGEIPYLALEYLHGVDVRAIMRNAKQSKQPVPLPIAFAIGAAISAGLHHAHEARTLDGRALEIVHRDVSPQNVMVTFDGDVKLIDFGIAKSRDRIHETRAGSLKGKVPYMAPEQVRATTLDRRTDIYAMGVVLYELLTGRRPYVIDKTDEPKGEFSLMMAIVGHKIARPTAIRPDLSPIVEAIVLRAIARKPEERFQTAQQLGQAIADLHVAAEPAAIASYMRRTFGDRPPIAAVEDVATEIRLVEQLRTSVDASLDPASISAAELGASPSIMLADEPQGSHARSSAAELAGSLARRGVAVVVIDARLDENFHGEARAAALSGAVIFNLSLVERISSFGVREWLSMHRRLSPDTTLYFARCSEAFLGQAGMMRAFVGNAQIVSFRAPYLCASCGLTFRHTFDCEDDAIGEHPPVVPCPACCGPANLDDDPSYFAPIRSHLERTVPSAVRAELARLEVAGAPFDKRIDGDVTTLRLLRPLDGGFRWAKLLDGVEGIVELALADGTLDSAALDAASAALHGLGSDVRALRISRARPRRSSRASTTCHAARSSPSR